MTTKVVAFIFARGGSVAVPRKNVREVAGKPLIGHAIECALNAELIDRVMVSTDDEEIASVARRFGAKVPFMRPAHLAGAASAELDAWRHAVEYLRSEAYREDPPEVFVSVPPTSPLRAPRDLDRIVEEYHRGEVELVFGVTESVRNPHMNIVTIDDDGYVHLAIPPTADSPHPATRQIAPTTYDVTTVGYATSLDYVMNAKSLVDGRIRAVLIPQERAWDIDSEFDLEVADFLMRRKGK
jgi:N-acylneuraminate cytidylyltransferase